MKIKHLKKAHLNEALWSENIHAKILLEYKNSTNIYRPSKNGDRTKNCSFPLRNIKCQTANMDQRILDAMKPGGKLISCSTYHFHL